ncbi:glycerophosphodiester phosphodiesterase [Thermaerobacter subterraneus]|uniref:glycerophosphodiester phosphodiesterase n=1 Tax=Thermaerobacter subterraneus TaxID=175696 RepID=UPI000304E37A|nr:glycerophosphodiester phosphodiesterase family protein [Thermaerobacter subterraneus]
MERGLPALHQALERQRPLTCAHRGGRARAPENTLSAFRQAVAAGVDMVELDVQLTADGEVVVLHDAELGRTTNGTGRVRDRRWDELSRLDAGAWFGARYRGERVPTLAEVLDWARGRVYLQIELKPYGADATLLCERVVELVRQRDMQDQVMLLSFDHHVLRWCKEMAPDILTGAICQARLIDPVGVVRSAGADVLCVDAEHLAPREVDLLHRARIAVHSFGSNPGTLRELAGWGVDIVQSDDPLALSELVATRR